MSVLEPTASNTIPTVTQDPPFIKFPPFPKPPEGVTIMPFKDFKARGIQLFSEAKKGGVDDGGGDEEEPELDALGIPTVELRVKHATDEAKSSTRKKRKKKKAAATEAAPVKKLPWYEEWEEGEDLRVTKGRYDLSIPAADRFFQSAYDFRTGRPWPPVVLGLNGLWDQFRLFTGLLVNPSVYRKVGAKKYADDASPGFDSDDDEEDEADADARPIKRQRSDGGDEESAAIPDPHKFDEESREEKISIFLSDPEKAVRIFLSSYMREHGLIWSLHNLINTPRLISFFLAFVLRNRVLPESTYQRGLKHALETIEHAKKELPLTNKVGQAIPEAFNEACREFFGRHGGMNWAFESTAATTEEKPKASINVTDTSTGAKINVELPTEDKIHLKDAIDDNVDMDIAVDTVSSLVTPITEDKPDDSNGWANGWGGGWGQGDGEPTGWNMNSWASEPVPGDGETKEGQGANGEDSWADTNATWNHESRTLCALLGPTTFPMTHTTGIVECSTRRIVAVHFPPDHPMGTPSTSGKEGCGRASDGGEWSASPSGVEDELDSRFAKVILEPWGREEGDISRPEIWSTSRGPVIDPNKPSDKAMVDNMGTDRKPHNPLTDNITLLVEPSFAETLALVPGLGLAAMWIEIVRQEGLEKESSGGANADPKVSGKFWYHEDVTGIFPSFYTPGDKNSG